MDAAVAAAPEARLGPFSRPLVAAISVDRQCLRWPVGPHRHHEHPAPEDVPALILGGSLDVRTPLENDRALAALMPRAQLVVVPGSGHDEIDSDVDGCVRRALTRFFAGRRVGDPWRGPRTACRRSRSRRPRSRRPRRRAASAACADAS